MKTPHGGLRRQFLSARLLRVVLTLVAAVGMSAPGWAAGVVNHSEIVERAIRKIEAEGGREYLALLQNNRGAVYYGSMFPDWGYSKKILDPNPPPADQYGAMAEIAHDTGHYQNTAWRTLSHDTIGSLPIFRQTLLAHAAPRARSESDAMLAFLLGVVSHQVSDGAFHFSQDGLPTGFQPEAEKWHYVVDPPMNHMYLELSLDKHFEKFGNIRLQCPLAPILCVSWEYPVFTQDAIVEAYLVSPYDGVIYSPTLPALQSAPGLQLIAYQAVLSGPLLTPMSIWVTTNMVSWPAGGVTDMVDLTIGAWDDTWRVLKDYAPLTRNTLAPEDPDGNDEWYRQPVILTLEAGDTYENVTDYGAPFHTIYQFDGSGREQYFDPLHISAEGETRLSFWSIDAFTNSEKPKELLLKIDLTPPVVTVDMPSTLTRLQPLTIHFGGNDPQPGSGLVTLTARLNQQPVTDEQVIDLFWWAPGVYSLELTGEDRAGWVTSQSHHLELQVTLESLQATVPRLCQQGHITPPGICNALSAKLEAALAARDHGNPNAMAGALNAFQNAVNAQAGKAISGEAASLLLADSGYVLAH